MMKCCCGKKSNSSGADGDDDNNISLDDVDYNNNDNYYYYYEVNPWKGISSYVVFTLQFFSITLDLFMDTSLSLEWHYTITSIETACALYQIIYMYLRMWKIYSNSSSSNNNNRLKPLLLIVLASSLLIQKALLGLALYSYTANNDGAEWSMFGLSLCWAVVNPMTFVQVQNHNEELQQLQKQQEEEKHRDGDDEEEEKLSTAAASPTPKPKTNNNIGPMKATIIAFRYLAQTSVFLLGVGTLFAISSAVLGTYQGAIINELTKSVTKINPSDAGSQQQQQEVFALTTTLLGVWLASNVSIFLFDLSSSYLFAKLEIRLRGAVFDRAVSTSKETSHMSAADYQARYASDVTACVGICSTLLQGVVVNTLLIVTNFVFLAIFEWRVAAVTLGFLATGVASGPTDSAGNAASAVQDNVTRGLSLLSEAAETSKKEQQEEKDEDGGGDGGKENLVADNCSPSQFLAEKQRRQLVEKHGEVLGQLSSELFRRNFYSNFVGTLINLYSSFLTVIVVITMSWAVFNGDMDSSDFLGVFFVFKQLQKPATKISGIIKKVVSKGANLQRLNGLLLLSSGDGGDDGGTGSSENRGSDNNNDGPVSASATNKKKNDDEDHHGEAKAEIYA